MQHPFSDRMRKRKAFADQELMDCTIASSIIEYNMNYQVPSIPHLPAIPLNPYQYFNTNLIPNNLNSTEISSIPCTQTSPAKNHTKPKISFSIESIIGIK